LSTSKQQSKLLEADKANGTTFSTSKQQSKLFEAVKNGTAFSMQAQLLVLLAKRAVINKEASKQIFNHDGNPFHTMSFGAIAEHTCTNEQLPVHGNFMSADAIVASDAANAAMVYPGTAVQATDIQNQGWLARTQAERASGLLVVQAPAIHQGDNGEFRTCTQLMKSGASSTIVFCSMNRVQDVLRVERLIHQRLRHLQGGSGAQRTKTEFGKRGFCAVGRGVIDMDRGASQTLGTHVPQPDSVCKVYMSVIPFQDFRLYEKAQMIMMMTLHAPAGCNRERGCAGSAPDRS
jgi:hypothetical protein